jgi:hypothetical protein
MKRSKFAEEQIAYGLRHGHESLFVIAMNW